MSVGREKSALTGDHALAHDATLRARRYSKPQSSSSPTAGPGPSTSLSRGRSSSQASAGLLSPPSPASNRSLHDPFSFHKRSSSFSGHGPTTVQRSLEKVMKARLVETIVTLDLPNPPQVPTPNSTVRQSRSKSPPGGTQRWETHSRTISATSSTLRSSPTTPSAVHDRLPLSPPIPSHSRTQSASQPSDPYHVSYVSPTHPPSTNPSWTNVELESFIGSSTLENRIRLNLWVNVEDQENRDLWTKVSADSATKVKGREGMSHAGSNWEAVLHWELDLSEAEPLTPEVKIMTFPSDTADVSPSSK